MTPQSIVKVVNKSHFKANKGFSLIEILVVLGLIALLAGLSLPALTGLSGSGKFNSAVFSISNLLDQARQYAVANNTYVWVAFYQEPGTNDLYAALIASKTGVDASGGAGTVDLTNSTNAIANTYSLLNKIEVFQRVALISGVTGSGFTSSSSPFSATTLPAINPAAKGLGISSSDMTQFRIKRPGTSTAVTFDKIIRYSPAGEAQASDAFVSTIEFAMQPKKGTVLDTKNVAVLRISGLVGNARIYRP